MKQEKVKNKIGLVVCHQLPHRSFFWNGMQFPICARCTGIHIGYLTMPIFLFNLCNPSIELSILMILPTYLDGLRQHFTKKESTNMIRVITGVISGAGTMALIAMFGQFVGRGIKPFL
tara:strand:- start:765 stop:1118 length:354 start_codon:yes stop_codon:yes gene_type:complete